MFTTISAKKILFTLIGTLLVIYSFSILGCSRGRLSDQDKQWIHDQFNVEAPENKNAQLTKENTGLKKENKELKERASQLTKENIGLNERNAELIKENKKLKGRVAMLELILKQPDKILRVGDELPDFRQDIRWDISSKPISSTRKFTGSRRGLMYKIEESTRKGQAIIYIEDATVDKRSFTPYIRFLKKGAQSTAASRVAFKVSAASGVKRCSIACRVIGVPRAPAVCASCVLN